jgi:branched-chain amino acid transport system substrate-binding protein
MQSAMRRPILLALLATLGAPLDGCSLRDVKHNDCTSDDQCAIAFGPGSTCSSGFCTDAATCTTGHDCRRAAGGGACVNGACVSTFPTDPACTNMYNEPPDILMQRADGPMAPLVIGAIFSLGGVHDQALTSPIRLAVREINKNGGLNGGQQIGVVFCDNGGPGDTAMGDARNALDVHALDYLAGTLGVPYIVGPLTSADSLVLLSELIKESYPTVIISPSATSPALTMAPDRLHPGDPTTLFWRTCPSDTLQGEVLAKNVIGMATPAITKVAVVYVNDAYGLGLATVFQSSFQMSVGGTTTLVPYDPSALGDPTMLAKLAMDADTAATASNAVLLIAEQGTVAVSIIEAMGAANTAVETMPFYFTDGSQDAALLDPKNPAWVQTLVKKAMGTAPASPSGQNYDIFNTNLMAEFGISGTSTSFLAQAYDATYVGAYGVIWASRNGTNYDGLDVAQGMAHLEAGTLIPVGPLNWPAGKGDLVMQGQIDIDGTSGPLQFDPNTGDAPASILVWGVAPDLSGYTTVKVVQPP